MILNIYNNIDNCYNYFYTNNMPDTMKIYIPKEELKEIGGKSLKNILNGLIKEGLIISYKEVLEFEFTKSQYIHIQTVLEFSGIKKMLVMSSKHTIKKEDE